MNARGPYKTKYGARLRRIQLTLDETTIERATAAGNGNISAGIRERFNPLPVPGLVPESSQGASLPDTEPPQT